MQIDSFLQTITVPGGVSGGPPLDVDLKIYYMTPTQPEKPKDPEKPEDSEDKGKDDKPQNLEDLEKLSEDKEKDDKPENLEKVARESHSWATRGVAYEIQYDHELALHRILES